jgi:RNA polymerase sigma-70 factor (ECF subfamily)
MEQEEENHREMERCIQTYRPMLMAQASRLTHDMHEAEDLVQDTLVRACTRWRQLANRETAAGWLATMQRNLFINQYRRRLRGPLLTELSEETVSFISGKPDAEIESAEASAIRKLENHALLQAIRALPRDYREAIALADIEGLPYQEIADRLGAPIGTIRSRIARGRRRLQRSLYPWRGEVACSKTDKKR